MNFFDKNGTENLRNKPRLVGASQELISDYVDGFLQSCISSYSKNGEAIEVSFRDIVHWVPYNDSHTHFLHTYPAKLLKHIPIFFLNSRLMLSKKNCTVLDPFCGSGTVLLESLLNGHHALGCDANPLARLIAKVKTTTIPVEQLDTETSNVIRRARRYKNGAPVNVVNVDLWFPKKTQRDLSRLIRSINEVGDEDIRDFLKVTYSNMVKKVSFSDPRLSVPVRLKLGKYRDYNLNKKTKEKIESINLLDVFEFFEKQYRENRKRLEEFNQAQVKNQAKVIGKDARLITKNLSDNSERLPDESVDFILTSPPYAGAQKYIRSSSLSLGWLGFCDEVSLRDLEKENIGREHYSKYEYEESLTVGLEEADAVLAKIRKINPLRSHINANYLSEMKSSIYEMYRVLRKGGYCVAVIGNNEVCKVFFETQKFFRLLAERAGFSTELVFVDAIHSRGLMTKRNKTAGVINSEWILVLKK